MNEPNTSTLRINDVNIDIDGTCNQGEIQATYAQLVSRLGPPLDGNGYKTDAEWDIQDGDTVATVYNWKNGPAYLGEDGLAVEDIEEWSIGGHGPEAAALVHRLVFGDPVKYRVGLSRTVDEHTYVYVEASSPKVAEELALEAVHDNPFDYEWESGYDVVTGPEACHAEPCDTEFTA